MKKAIALVLIGCFTLSLTGCGSVRHIKSNLVGEARLKRGITRIYDRPYPDVYEAIINVLENKLRFDIYRNYTNDDMIAVVHYSLLIVYAYVFNLRRIDEKSTEVTLRSRGSLNSVSDKDILDKYLLKELGAI